MNTYQAGRAIISSNQRYYELGKIAHKVLAWQLKHDEQKRTINAINTGNAETYIPVEINDAFKQYYIELYTSQASTDSTQMDSLLSLIHLPCLSEEDRLNLDQPFSASELIEAILLMLNNKSHIGSSRFS